MRKLKKFLCVALATATLVTSVLSPSGQAQATVYYGKGIARKYTIKGVNVQTTYADKDDEVESFVRNKNKYPVMVKFNKLSKYPLYIKSGGMIRVERLNRKKSKIVTVKKISTKTYNKNYKRVFNVRYFDHAFLATFIHPHQHFTVKEGKDYDKLHAKQIKECKELKKQTEEEYEKVDKEYKEICHKFDDDRKTHDYDYDYESPYYEECYELQDKRNELKDKKMSLESKYCDLVNSNISPYMYTKDGKRRKTIYNEDWQAWHNVKVSDVQLCYKYDKNNSLISGNKKNFKPFIYVETEAKSGAHLYLSIIAYDKNGNIIKIYDNIVSEWLLEKGTLYSYEFKYPSNMASFDVVLMD